MEESNIPFEPLSIYIDKGSNRLYLLSGKYILREYPVALGKSNLTPAGVSSIESKMSLPDKQIPLLDNVYGTRAMELSDRNYAIHGTNDQSTIGHNVSLGCIRLPNPDIEELYSMTSLHTTVVISDKPLDSLLSTNQKSTYNENPGPQEENPVKDYSWND